MNYKWHYDNLIATRKNRKIEKGVYYEKHHIIPKSMGGSNDKSNMIYLTAREHFLAHWLLWRIYRNKSTAHSFLCLCGFRNNYRVLNFSSVAYAEARESLKNCKVEELYCKVCEKLIDTSISPYKRWCSIECHDIDIPKKMPNSSVCENCNKHFFYRKQAIVRKWCSKSCAAISANKVKKIKKYEFYKNDKLIEIIYGRILAVKFCKNKISLSIFKEPWNEWKCIIK